MCAINPPPSSTTFTLLIAFVIIICILPLDYAMGYISEEYASKRPYLEALGLSSDYWLGSVSHALSGMKSTVSAAHSIPPDTAINKNQNQNEPDSVLSVMSEQESDFVAMKAYENYSSPHEELVRILTDIQNQPHWTSSVSDPVSGDGFPSDGAALRSAEDMKATRARLKINPDGTLQPLTLRQRMLYSSRQNLLEKKISSARLKSEGICDCISEMEVSALRDISLMRTFILEHVSFIFRSSVESCLEEIAGAPPERVHALKWGAAWVAITLSLLFCLYWIFAWGVSNGGQTVHSWGVAYAASVFQDALIFEVARIFIRIVFALVSVRPQLQAIKRVINDCALSLIQDEFTFSSTFNAAQHFSPACRASRSSRLSDLPAAAVLRKITDADISRCRQFRNYSSQSIILYIVIITAVVAAISQTFVDQAMSIGISTVWLGFVLVNVKILSFSSVVLVILYAIVFGPLLYRATIYSPSIRQTRAVREMMQHHAGDFKSATTSRHALRHRTPFGLDIPVRAMGRISTKLNSCAGYWHTLFSNEVGEDRKEKVRQDDAVWCGMNARTASASACERERGSDRERESSAVGSNFSFSRIPPASSSVQPRSQPKPLSRPRPRPHPHPHPCRVATLSSPSSSSSTCSQVLSAVQAPHREIPAIITSMRPTGSMVVKREDDRIKGEVAAMQYFGAIAGHSVSHGCVPVLVAGMHGKKSFQSRQFSRKNMATRCPQVALTSMLQRHLLGVASFERGDEVDIFHMSDTSKIFLLESEAISLLRWVWGIFAPDVGFNIEEREEMILCFLEWRVRRDSELSATIVLCTWRRGYLDFKEFSDWFLSQMRRIGRLPSLG